MKTTVLEYRESPIKCMLSGLLILTWSGLLILHLPRYAIQSDFLFYAMLIAHIALIVGSSISFVSNSMRKTMVIHEGGIYINRRDYSYSDILSVRMNEKNIYLRVKKDGTFTLPRKQFSNISSDELIEIFSNIQSKIVHLEAIEMC